MAVSNFVAVFPQGITNLVSLLHYGTYARFMIGIPIGPFFLENTMGRNSSYSSSWPFVLKTYETWKLKCVAKTVRTFRRPRGGKRHMVKVGLLKSACWKCLTSASMFSISLDFLWSEHCIRALHWIIVLCCGIPRFVFVQKVIFNQLNNLTLMELWRLILNKHRQRFSREHFSRSFGPGEGKWNRRKGEINQYGKVEFGVFLSFWTSRKRHSVICSWKAPFSLFRDVSILPQ